jgi:protein-L-isoaspartate(D-aspartate) O-methyltransferase
MRRVAWVVAVAAWSQSAGHPRADQPQPEERVQERLEMVSEQIEARGVADPAVLEAMRKVPRHRFVPHAQLANAYQDRPLPIGHGQTISQPYIVARMTELAGVKPGDKVLEVGTGSAYQAAVLVQMGVKLFSIEIISALAKRAKATLTELGYAKDVEVRHGDGYAGWPEQAPFDAILVTAAPPKVPKPLKEQLKLGGRLIIPVGKRYQSLLKVTRTKTGYRGESVIPVRFVPMTGEAQGH